MFHVNSLDVEDLVLQYGLPKENIHCSLKSCVDQILARIPWRVLIIRGHLLKLNIPAILCTSK